MRSQLVIMKFSNKKKPFKTYGNSAEWNFKITLSSREFVPFNQHSFFCYMFSDFSPPSVYLLVFLVCWLGQGGKPLSLSLFPPFFWTFFKLRNADPRSLDANLGPVPRVPLPFSCTMISSAAVEDVETSVVSKKRHLGVKRNLLGIFGKDFFGRMAFSCK